MTPPPRPQPPLTSCLLLIRLPPRALNLPSQLSAQAAVAAVLSRGDLLDLAVTHQDEATHAAGALQYQYMDPILDPASFQADLRLRHSRSAWISQMAFEKLGAKLLKAATSP